MCAVLRTPYMIYGELRVCTASSGSDQYTVCILLTVYQRTVSLHPALCTPGWSIHSVLLRASIKPSCPLYSTVSTSVADPYPTRRCPPTSAVRYGNARNLQRLDFPFRLFLAVFFPFSFCRSSPPLRFFFFFSLLFPLSLPLFSLFPSILLFVFVLYDIFLHCWLPRGSRVFLTAVCATFHCPRCSIVAPTAPAIILHSCWVSVPRLDVVRDPPLRRLPLQWIHKTLTRLFTATCG